MNPLDVVVKLIGLILDLVPHTVAQDLLSQEAIKRQNAIADAAETAKWPDGDAG